MFYLIINLFLIKYCLSIDINDQCLIGDTCRNSSNISPSIYSDEFYIQSRNCFCDSVCEEYGDCCDSIRKPSNKYECVDYFSPTWNNRLFPFDSLSIWMRTECLSMYIGSNFDKQCRNLNNELFLDNPILFIPVTSSQTNITYRNYYCAYCNNDANDINIKFWEYRTLCYGLRTDDGGYLTLKNDQQVEYYIHNLTKNCTKFIVYPRERGNSQPSVFIRPCKNSLPSICPVKTPAELARNCALAPTAYRYVENSTIIYRNSYCAQCNYQNELTCSDPYLRSALPTLAIVRAYPLSILFDPNLLKSYLNNDKIPRFIYSIDYNCSKSNELYDLFEKKCLPFTNSSDHQFIISMKCSIPIQTFIQIDENTFYENGSLYLDDYSILLTKDEYVFISNNRIVFCSDNLSNSDTSELTSPSFPFYRHILSIICALISLVCLVIFFIIFFLIPSLQNLPGKCLLFLSISLFIGQLTFVSLSNLTEYYSACFASALLIHYFYLSSFIWLLIISIHIHSSFNNEIIPKDQINKKNFRLIAYNIIVWCSSGIIILIGCLIQYLKPESNFSPGYALIYCSISNRNAMILFFLAPIGCILLIVGILFLKTLINIYQTHKISKLANTTSSSNLKDNNLIFIYLRLASLMGIQWILLIAALLIKQTWLWIIFEIINSLPGLFICFGFLCSIKLFNQLKQKIPMNLIRRRQSSKSNTTSSTILISSNNINKKFHF